MQPHHLHNGLTLSLPTWLISSSPFLHYPICFPCLHYNFPHLTRKMSIFSSTLSPYFLMLLLLVLYLSTSPYAFAHNFDNSRSDVYLETQYLKVPVNVFVSSLTSTISIIRDVTSIFTDFGGFFGEFRLSNAMNDCLDLLDFSVDELSWTISASQSPYGSKHNSTGDLSNDLRTWLSAALVNQDTCIQGLDGTSSVLTSLVANGLNQITSLVQQLLTQVGPSPNSRQVLGGELSAIPNTRKHNQFPFWFKREDRKLLLINGATPDVIVAADGTGNFTMIMDAVEAAPEYSMRRFVIYIKRGVYNEYVEIKKRKWNIVMVGDGMNVTIITGNRNYVDGWTTFRSATFAVSGRGFMARDITFENTAGPSKHQAVALRSDSDLSVFYRCKINGYQDTLYTHTMRQFYRECHISGTIDFIFGDAAAVFQYCHISAKLGLPDQKNTITAHGRKDPSEPTGYSIQFCNITADIDLLPYINSTYTFLGRPWKNFSRTIVMQSYISDVLRPEGWLEWNGNWYLNTLYFAEYMNSGLGAGLGQRVEWPGYHVLNSTYQANNFTVTQFIKGNLWLPATGVKYTAGLEA